MGPTTRRPARRHLLHLLHLLHRARRRPVPPRASLIGYTDLDSASPRNVSFKLPPDAPAGFTISPNRNPMWTDDLSGILFGIHEARIKDTPDRDTPAASETIGGGAAPDANATTNA